MANEFICSDCGEDGTRCKCHLKRKRVYCPSQDELRIKKIKDCERELNKLLNNL